MRSRASTRRRWSTIAFRDAYELARCAVCDGADTREISGQEALKREAELLWEFHMRRLSPRTPPDRLVDRVAFSQQLAWRLVQCRACGLVYRNPSERRANVIAVYREDDASVDALDSLHRTQRGTYRTQSRRLARLAPRGHGLEVGSYVGAFLSAARDSNWQFEGLDVNANVNAFARTRGFVVHDGDLESFRPDRTFDAVAIWNTFDQLPDPDAAARAAWRLLRPRGLLAIRVPNGACYVRWRARLDGRASAFATAVLAHNNLLTFPYRFGFTPSSLSRLLTDAGFAIERVVPDVLVPTSDEWTRPWARAEARVVKALTRRTAPWFEIYAYRPDG